VKHGNNRKTRIMKLTMIVVAAALAGTLVTPDGENELTGKLTVFHAGSLSVPFKEISAEFKKLHPKVTIQLEAGGSRTCARKISDLNRSCDVMASADYTVIDQLLVPEFAEWNMKFAANEMAIVYHEESRRGSEINAGNWPDILLDKRVAYGRSDPNADPCGYRAILTMKLAEIANGRTGLANQLLGKDNRYIRPKETDLLALLESNTIDYIFLYRSVAQQHGLKFLTLPDTVNLKSVELGDVYAKASVEISGQKPGTFITKKGAPMVYGITIPKNAENPKVAEAFVAFILEKEHGRQIMADLGQPSVIPSASSTYEHIPDGLKKFATPTP
jgi:molybdate/tungstate transport system substrate-binding protein